MAQTAKFSRELLEEAKRFLEKARDNENGEADNAYLHAALVLAFCSLEGHVNAISEEFLSRPEISDHDRGILMEREVRLEHGEFTLTSSPKMMRLQDRILFLHARISGIPLDRRSSWWSRLQEAIKLRNRLSHPKEEVVITTKQVSAAINAIIESLNSLYRAIYKKNFPGMKRGLGSRLHF